MKRYTMFLEGKNQNRENDYTTESNLQSQWNLYKITNGIFHRTRRKNFTIHHSLAQSLSHVQLFATPWTVAHQAPLSMGFSRQEYWSGSPFPSPMGAQKTLYRQRDLAKEEWS